MDRIQNPEICQVWRELCRFGNRQPEGEIKERARTLAGNLLLLNGHPNDPGLRLIVAAQVAALDRATR